MNPLHLSNRVKPIVLALVFFAFCFVFLNACVVQQPELSLYITDGATPLVANVYLYGCFGFGGGKPCRYSNF